MGGLESLRNFYGSQGFLDIVFIPETKFASGSSLKLDVQEGSQYRMDKLEILGPSEVVQKLQARWELAAGAVFDTTYVTTFLEKNSSLLPSDFTQSNGVELFEDCSDATVSVHLHLTQDPQHAALDRAKHVECPQSTEKKKRSD